MAFECHSWGGEQQHASPDERMRWQRMRIDADGVAARRGSLPQRSSPNSQEDHHQLITKETRARRHQPQTPDKSHRRRGRGASRWWRAQEHATALVVVVVGGRLGGSGPRCRWAPHQPRRWGLSEVDGWGNLLTCPMSASTTLASHGRPRHFFKSAKTTDEISRRQACQCVSTGLQNTTLKDMRQRREE